jgi:hypothetical protein
MIMGVLDEDDEYVLKRGSSVEFVPLQSSFLRKKI